MELRWGKFQVLQIQCTPRVTTLDGTPLPLKTRMEYLGTILTEDLRHTHELTRRIAFAKADFFSLARIWRHSTLTRQRKLLLYESLVEARLLYGLSTLVLTVSQKRKLNGFQNRCLRTIAGIRPSYISRVSNDEVLRRTGHRLATDSLLRRQMHLLGKVLRAPEGHPLRVSSFIPKSNHPVTERYVRRVGRPAREWVPEMIKAAVDKLGSMQKVVAIAPNREAWRKSFL